MLSVVLFIMLHVHVMEVPINLVIVCHQLCFKDLTIAMSEATNGAIDFNPNSLYFFANNYVDAVSTLTQNLYSFN
jgi:hypothetical protein